MAESKNSSGFVVVLDEDIDSESTEKLLNAIQMIKGVVDVKPIAQDSLDDRVKKSRIIKEIRKAVLEQLKKL